MARTRSSVESVWILESRAMFNGCPVEIWRLELYESFTNGREASCRCKDLNLHGRDIQWRVARYDRRHRRPERKGA